jgi:hypothetical protein
LNSFTEQVKAASFGGEFVHYKILLFAINKKTFPAVGSKSPVIGRYFTVPGIME